jgi:long-chain acyl-CoA synthetase
VLLSHETILARTDAADQALRITPADTVIWVLSMSFHFVVTILLYLRRGATIVICRQPFPESFLDAGSGRAGTVFYATPFHYQVLAASPLAPPDCLSGLRLALSVAMKLGDETAEAFASKFGIGLAEAYGIIEVGLPFVNSRAAPRKLGCVGRALPGYEIRIAAPDRQGVGTILLRGPGMFDAYVSPWRLRSDIAEDGWFDTGDVGLLDADGDLFILGREKNVINFAGMKVFPDEVESVLGAHPAVADCEVYGVSHPLWGQMPCARIVVRPGATPPAHNDLRRFCFQRLAGHKVPKEFVFVDGLIRTVSGKLRRIGDGP